MGSVKELGYKSYLKAHWNDFNGALDCLNVAIRRYPKEEKLYNNRSFVLFNLGLYNQALEDAEFMVENFPLYPKSYYRKGEICMALKKHKEAIAAFEKVVELSPSCKEAHIYLREAMLDYLCGNGKYFRSSASKALNLTNDVNQAEQFLAVGGLSKLEEDEEIYFSDDDNITSSVFNVQKREKPNPQSSKVVEAYDPLTDPLNPFKSASIWVGNVTDNCTEAVLKSVFKKYGVIVSCHIQHKNFCAFINFASPAMASNAMRKFPVEGVGVDDTVLVIRFPDNASKNKTVVKPNVAISKKKKK